MITRETTETCEFMQHKPVSFTPSEEDGSPPIGVCLCGKFTWLPRDRENSLRQMAKRLKQERTLRRVRGIW